MTNAELESLLASERITREEAERERDEARSALRLFVTKSWKPEADGHAEGCPRIGISLPGGGGCSVTCGKLRAALGAEPGDAALTQKEGQGAPAARTTDEPCTCPRCENARRCGREP